MAPTHSDNAHDMGLLTLYNQFVSRLRTFGVVLRSNHMTAYETYLVREQSLFPVWVNPDEAEKWRALWCPDRQVECLDGKRLRSIISESIGNDALLALGLMPSTFVTFHPDAVIAHLECIEEL
jgi:hypothetical protein